MHSTPQVKLARAHVRPHIDGLTGIRALAAAWVVIEHFRLPLYALFPATQGLHSYVEAGYLGVEVFFILSGFIIAYTYAHKFEQFTIPTYKRFILLRVARIYPVHLVTLTSVAVLVVAASAVGVHLNDGDKYDGVGFFANVFMLQAVPPFLAWNGPAWSICAEFAAYLAFPLVAVWVARIRSAKAGLLAGLAVLVVGAVLMVLMAAFVNSSPTSYELIWLRISTEFTAGALLYAGWKHFGPRQHGPWGDWVAVVAVAGVASVIALVGGDSALTLASVPLIGAFVLACASATGWTHRILASRPMIWGGKVSYSVYMTHFILLMTFGKILPWAAYTEDSLVVRLAIMAFYYGAVVAVGAACYYLIEEPSRRAIRRFADSRNAPLEVSR